VNLALAQAQLFAVMPESRGLQFASQSFDAAASELSIILVRGAALYLLSQSQQQAPEQLAAMLEACEITHATLPPLLLKDLSLNQLRSITSLVVAGESIGERDSRIWSEGRILFNGYGPTEATVCASVGLLGSGPVNIGKPLSNCQIYVLDKTQSPQPQ